MPFNPVELPTNNFLVKHSVLIYVTKHISVHQRFLLNMIHYALSILSNEWILISDTNFVSLCNIFAYTNALVGE